MSNVTGATESVKVPEHLDPSTVTAHRHPDTAVTQSGATVSLRPTAADSAAASRTRWAGTAAPTPPARCTPSAIEHRKACASITLRSSRLIGFAAPGWKAP